MGSNTGSYHKILVRTCHCGSESRYYSQRYDLETYIRFWFSNWWCLLKCSHFYSSSHLCVSATQYQRFKMKRKVVLVTSESFCNMWKYVLFRCIGQAAWIITSVSRFYVIHNPLVFNQGLFACENQARKISLLGCCLSFGSCRIT